MSDRRAQIRKVIMNNVNVQGDSMYVVHLYEGNKLVQTRELPGKSLRYAEDLAENWESGIIQLLID